MDFEFDPRKSEANKTKHGIDFITAQALWLDEDAIEVDVASTGERRNLVIGRLNGKHWTAVITIRNGMIRLISVRRSREKEVRLYEKNQSIGI